MTGGTKDIVVDANVMRLYDNPKHQDIRALFDWLASSGSLAISQKLLNEYVASTNGFVLVLINRLIRDGRYHMYPKRDLEGFTMDRHYRYTCNKKDIHHARLVFLSYRKRLISFDKKLRKDVNEFRRIDGIKPCACRNPRGCCLD